VDFGSVLHRPVESNGITGQLPLAPAAQFLPEVRSLSRRRDGLLSHFLERRFLDNFLADYWTGMR
jgi:hypothetical protein